MERFGLSRTDINFGKTAEDYGRYRAGFPQEFFEKLSDYRIGEAGQRILDLGAGTGTLARGFARCGCEVTALDLARTHGRSFHTGSSR